MPARKPPRNDELSAYRTKRSADRTPEPFAAGSSVGGHLFVVQQHAARRTHHDFRLEMQGVLVSWVVPIPVHRFLLATKLTRPPDRVS